MENGNDNISTATTTAATTTTSTNSIVSVENLNSVANWVSATVISAFFSSLERFSCVNVATTDPDDDDDDDEGHDRPLALSTNPHLQHDDVSHLPQHAHTAANYIQPCSCPLQSLAFWLNSGLPLSGRSSFPSMGSRQFHEHEFPLIFCAPQPPPLPFFVSFYEEFLS
ncbi:unnamed protein product [Dovyalis caffra]|uniref:Uncharacterized protein n=1 Tax=Dovyalis caffra TaxID=77055 RepID=A0AAV1RH50_9ROSI|nr:unnamed protein product [Dovyalis caffra]